MSTRFRTLPEDCVQLIFDRIPTQNLLQHISLVSRAWQRHQKLNCRGRKSLILMQWKRPFYELIRLSQPFAAHKIGQNGNSSNYESFIEHYQIHISPMRNPKVKFLIETFPHLHTLIVSTDRISAQYVQSYVKMISHYASKLIKLEIYFGNKLNNAVHRENISQIIIELFHQLNLLTQLEHFTFYAKRWRISPPIEEPKFLTRMKKFYFEFDDLHKEMLNWVRKYDREGRLNQLTQIYLNTLPVWGQSSSNNQFDHYPLSNLYLIVPYSNHIFDNNEELLKRIVTRFPSLTTIRYTLKESITSLAKLSTILSTLTKLVHAHLNIKLLVPSNEPINLNSADQLKSIKALDLKFMYISEYLEDFQNFCQTQPPVIVYIFPNLQSIRITNRERHNSVVDTSEKLVKQFLDNLRDAYGSESLRTEYKQL